MKKREQITYITEEIRQIPVVCLLDLEMTTLNIIEDRIRDEVRRTSLALKWIRGIKCIKKASKKGGRNG